MPSTPENDKIAPISKIEYGFLIIKTSDEIARLVYISPFLLKTLLKIAIIVIIPALTTDGVYCVNLIKNKIPIIKKTCDFLLFFKNLQISYYFVSCDNNWNNRWIGI